ncbi:MAG: CheR family methyltransferase [Burkholderiales bacterium]
MLQLVRRRLGLDFSDYKTPMLYRRIRRRVGLSRMAGLAEYLRHLSADPHELEVLAADFLIGVTEFFREPHAWEVLEQQILPTILQHAPDATELRAWVPACSTGEEAYSMAMMLVENAERAKRHLNIQIFASDVDKRALDIGRRARYPKSIAHSVGLQRLRRFFREEDGTYQVKKELRQLVTFARQNVISDPPFSRMDIVSCRNLLIYMQPVLQRRVLQLLHFALRPGGHLLLGKSETAAAQEGLFTIVAPAGNILRRVESGRAPQLDFGASAKTASNAAGAAGSVNAGANGDMNGETTGEAIRNASSASPSDTKQRADRPAPQRDDDTAASGSTQASTTPSARSAVPATPVNAAAPSVAVESVEHELARTRRELRATVEELESTNEELKVANEEAMSTNEELQSTNEELATSKEELESVNEELIAVNQQLEMKIEELVTVNEDLGNLLASTSIPTLFLDSSLSIKRYTPAATRLFQLIPGDLQRPLTDIASAGDMDALVRDARSVLHDLSTVETEEALEDGTVFLRRTSPYRTRDDHIAGVVVTFTDVSRLKAANAAIDRFAAVMRASQDAIVMHDGAGKVLAWNPSSA